MSKLIYSLKNISKKERNSILFFILTIFILIFGIFIFKDMLETIELENSGLDNNLSNIKSTISKELAERDELLSRNSELKKDIELAEKNLQEKLALESKPDDVLEGDSTNLVLRNESLDILLFKFINEKLKSEIVLETYEGNIDNGWKFSSNNRSNLYSFLSVVDLYFNISISELEIKGSTVTFSGEWVDEIHYSKQFSVTPYSMDLTEGDNGIGSREILGEDYEIERAREIIGNRNIKRLEIETQWDWIREW